VPEFRNGLHSTQQPHIPIYLAGFAEPALRRVARRAAGWLPVLPVGRMGPEFIAKTRASLDRIAEEAGRDPSTIDVVLRVNAAVRVPLPELAGAVLDAAEKTGIEEFFFDLTYQTDTVEGVLGQAHELLELVNAG
jgi:alkanesulfonate monooxygenase SsuD/methylene tetrahydromethanopterin reductase-like flavin-dependent oxidoreductase (luciferase family)